MEGGNLFDPINPPPQQNLPPQPNQPPRARTLGEHSRPSHLGYRNTMNRNNHPLRVMDHVSRHDRVDRVIRAFEELNEVLDREKRLAQISRNNEIKLRYELEATQNSSVTLE